MIKRETIEAVVGEMAKLNGHELNGQDRLIIRTCIGTSLAARERHRQRMSTGPYQWRKPKRLRR
ncbi:hypothetical protein [Pectobacterium aroidearum]|uniref:hypothetical protein n=1 Tax=Pectobacterium aroidearum TaxID=1201031 RepID=UPI0032EAEDA1